MSAFSEVFAIIKDRRNLSVSQIAEMTNQKTGLLFQWLGGVYPPQNWKQVDSVVKKLWLSEKEYKELKDAYEKTILGEESYVCHKKIIEIFHVLEQEREEYHAMEAVQQGVCGLETALEFVALNSKLEVLNTIQMALTSLAALEEKYLCLKFQNMHTEIRMLIKMFCSKVNNCAVEEIVYFKGEKNDFQWYNLELFKEMIEIVVQQNAIHMYYLEDQDGEQGFGENWIISETFAIHYNEELNRGMLFTHPKWIEFYKNAFYDLKRQSQTLARKNRDILAYTKNYKDKNISGFSIEYMPCISSCLSRELLNAVIYPEITDRDVLIETILYMNVKVHASEHFHWDSCFSQEGLIEFMESGRICMFPSYLYRPLSKKERCEILQAVICLAEEKSKLYGEFCYHLIRKGALPMMKNLYIEQINGKVKHLVVDIHFDGEKERLCISNHRLQEQFQRFFSVLERCGYIYSSKETLLYMKKIVNEYQQAWNL